MKNKLEECDIESVIVKEDDYKVGTKVTVVILTLENGFEVLGVSACVDPANYDHEIGKKWARIDAVKKIWAAEAYLLQERLYKAKLNAAPEDKG